jgi:hypothetical protein
VNSGLAPPRGNNLHQGANPTGPMWGTFPGVLTIQLSQTCSKSKGRPWKLGSFLTGRLVCQEGLVLSLTALRKRSRMQYQILMRCKFLHMLDVSLHLCL